MAQPPKSSTRKPMSQKPMAAGVKAAPVASPVKAAEKPMPFVIDPAEAKEIKPAIADPAPVVETPIVETPIVESPVAESTPATTPEPVEPEPVSVASPDIEATPVEPLVPSQPAVADPFAAAIETGAVWQTPQILEGNHVMNEAIETTKKFAEEAKTRVQSLMADMNDKAKAAMEKSSKTMEEIGDITKGNLEAVVESSKIAAKGFESIGQSAAEYSRTSFEKTSATLKSFASVKSPAEFFQLQSELMTSAFDTFASESAKTSEVMLKLAGDIAQPISTRVAVVTDKFKALAA